MYLVLFDRPYNFGENVWKLIDNFLSDFFYPSPPPDLDILRIYRFPCLTKEVMCTKFEDDMPDSLGENVWKLTDNL